MAQGAQPCAPWDVAVTHRETSLCNTKNLINPPRCATFRVHRELAQLAPCRPAGCQSGSLRLLQNCTANGLEGERATASPLNALPRNTPLTQFHKQPRPLKTAALPALREAGEKLTGQEVAPLALSLARPAPASTFFLKIFGTRVHLSAQKAISSRAGRSANRTGLAEGRPPGPLLLSTAGDRPCHTPQGRKAVPVAFPPF